MDAPRRSHGRAHEARRAWIEVGALAAFTLALRLVQLDHTPYIDELNHALAARSLLADGSLQAGAGEPYTRSLLFTWLVAAMMAAFGDNLVVARIPAVLGGVALVVAVFMWVRRVAGSAAAWTSGLLLALAPISLYLSQQVRFYTLHALLVWLAGIAIFTASHPGGRRDRLSLGVGALLCLALAYHLQPATVVAIAGIAAWLVVDRGPSVLRWVRAGGMPRLLPFALALLLGAAALAAFALIGPGASMIEMARYADVWAEANRDSPRFYHDVFTSQYPTLWTLFPIAVLIAASRYSRAAVFCTVVFVTGFVFHSVAAWKHERYLFHALPFFFALWGLAAGVALPWLRARLEQLLRVQLGVAASRRATSALFGLIIAGAVVFAAAGNAAATFTHRMLTVSDADWTLSRAYRGEADWEAALPVLAAEAERADVVMTSALLKAFYYLGRLEIGLSATEVTRGPDGEFGIAPKEGVPVISQPASVELVHRCVASGLVIADQRSWRRPWGVTDPVADYLEAEMEPVPLSARTGVVAYRWSSAASGGEDCGVVQQALRAGAD